MACFFPNVHCATMHLQLEVHLYQEILPLLCSSMYVAVSTCCNYENILASGAIVEDEQL